MVYHQIVILTHFCPIKPLLFKSYLDLECVEPQTCWENPLWNRLGILDEEIYGTNIRFSSCAKGHTLNQYFRHLWGTVRLEGVQILNQIRAHLNNERNWKEIIRNQPHPIICSFWSIPDGRTMIHMIHIWVRVHPTGSTLVTW